MPLESASMFPPDDIISSSKNRIIPVDDKEHLQHLERMKQPMCAVIDNELALEAFGSNIIVLEDKFRTGFECKSCDGEGHSTEVCPYCNGLKQVAKNPEFNLSEKVNWDAQKGQLPDHFIERMKNREKEEQKEEKDSGGLMPCTKCLIRSRTGEAVPSGFIPCSSCKGNCSTLIVPEESMRRPSSGKVVSTGLMVGYDEKTGIKMPGWRNELPPIQCGDRVLYSNHTGYALTFKQQTVFRVMHWYEVLTVIHGTGNLSKKLG